MVHFKAWSTAFVFLFVLCAVAYGQLSHSPNPLRMTAHQDSLDTKLEIYFTNTKDTTYNVYWKIVKDSTTWNKDWATYLCDLEVCYNLNQDKSSPNLPNKFNKGTHKFEFHFLPKGKPGCSIVTLKLYGDKNFTQEIYSAPININNCPTGPIYHTPDPLTMSVSKDTLDKKLEIYFTNTQDTVYNVYWKLEKDPVTWNSAWSTYICDLEVCYNINQDKSSPNLPNKFKKGEHKFEFHFLPNGVDGCTILKLRLFGDKNFTQELYSATINVNGCVSSSSELVLSEMQMYPNPTSAYFSLPAARNGQKITIVNNTGQVVHQCRAEEGQQYDVSHFQKGYYLVILKNENGQPAGMARLVVQ